MFNLCKNLLAAKRRNPEDLIQILVVAAIIVFGILRVIVRSIKAKMEEKAGQNEYKPPTARPKKRRYTVDINSGYKTLEQLRDEKIAQIRAALGIPTPPEEQKYEPVEPPPAIEQPVAAPVPSPAPAMYETHKAYKTKRETGHPAAASSRETVRKLLFSAPSDLRKAIVYQEILGKPLALRDTQPL